MKAKGKKTQKHVILPDVFGKDSVKSNVLPLGYHANIHPNEDYICNLNTCEIEGKDEP